MVVKINGSSRTCKNDLISLKQYLDVSIWLSDRFGVLFACSTGTKSDVIIIEQGATHSNDYGEG